MLTALFESLGIVGHHSSLPHLSWLLCLLPVTFLPADQYLKSQVTHHGSQFVNMPYTQWFMVEQARMSCLSGCRMNRPRTLSFGGLGRNVVGLNNLDSTGEALSSSGVWRIRSHTGRRQLSCLCMH